MLRRILAAVAIVSMAACTSPMALQFPDGHDPDGGSLHDPDGGSFVVVADHDPDGGS